LNIQLVVEVYTHDDVVAAMLRTLKGSEEVFDRVFDSRAPLAIQKRLQQAASQLQRW